MSAFCIAFILSFASVMALIGINVFKPILGLIGAPLWVDIVLYTITIFILQLQADMEIVKKFIESFLPVLLKKSGLQDIFPFAPCKETLLFELLIRQTVFDFRYLTKNNITY